MKSVKCVYGQEGGIEGDFRLRKLRHLGGEERTTTLHKENGLRLKLDVETCYFSPRLSTERLRIADQVEEGEKVLNMFAGVGPYSILIAKKTQGLELRAQRGRVQVPRGEQQAEQGRRRASRWSRATPWRCPEKLKGEGKFDRILMPHPSQSNLFLPAALSMLAPGGVVHYYRHVTGEDVARG